jgi:hypothetical protein
MLKTLPKQLLGSLPLAFALPEFIHTTFFAANEGNNPFYMPSLSKS